MRDSYRVTAEHQGGERWTLRSGDVRVEMRTPSAVLAESNSIVEAAALARASISALIDVPETEFDINVVVIENDLTRLSPEK